MAVVSRVAARRRRVAAWVSASLLIGGIGALGMPASSASEIIEVVAVRETEPAEESGDSLDDPAIWVDPADPSRSVIIGANHGGDTVEVFDLSGRRLQRLVLPGANNVDLRPDFPLGGTTVPLVTVIGGGHMHFFRLDPATRLLKNVTKGGSVKSTSSHGACMYRSPRTGTFYAFRVTRFGPVDQFELTDDNGQVAARQVRHFDVNPRMPLADGGRSALEACVVDDRAGSLFIVEEEYAIWRYGAEPSDPAGSSHRDLVDKRVSEGGHIVPQIEGLAVVPQPDGGGFLIASDQGDYTFNVYRSTPPYQFVRKVRVVAGPHADGCERTDGIEVATAALPGFPRGLFVCQDNKNTAPAPGNQNFKLVPLELVVPLAASSVPDPGPGPAPSPPPGPAPSPAPAPDSPTDRPPGGPPVAAAPTASGAGGYWMLEAGGRVHPFGGARHLGEPRGSMGGGAKAVDLEPWPSGEGYWVLADSGEVFAFGGAPSLGGVAASALQPDEKATSLSATSSGAGYWVFSDRGRVLAFGDAAHLGDVSGLDLNGPVLDSVSTPTGHGYYMVASDGGIFAFGDARFFGSMGDHRLNAPVQSLVPDPDGAGYWLVASDGGVFAFDAGFRGSMGDGRLNAPVTGMVAFGNGYLMVATDGGIFNFSDRPFFGSLGDDPPARPITGVAALDGS